MTGEHHSCGCCELPDARATASTTRPGCRARLSRRHPRHDHAAAAGAAGDPARSTTTAAGTRPLAALTTRAPDDPAIALLDAWATVADVLTFYQERIANEGFLRTATERRSVLELAR